MKDKLLHIIEHYGVSNQQRKLEEEIFELQEAINTRRVCVANDYANLILNDNNVEHIAEELADCFVLLNQFKEYYGITNDEIQKIMKYKVGRQIGRIKKENE